MSSPDPQLIGWWKVEGHEMPGGKVLKVIGGMLGQWVHFSEKGHFNVFPDDDDVECYRSAIAQPYNELDIWIRGLEPLKSLCIYEIKDGILKITVAGAALGRPKKLITRPTEMRMDAQLDWVLITMKAGEPPKRRGRKSPGWKLEPGKLIPKGFLDKSK